MSGYLDLIDFDDKDKDKSVARPNDSKACNSNNSILKEILILLLAQKKNKERNSIFIERSI